MHILLGDVGCLTKNFLFFKEIKNLYRDKSFKIQWQMREHVPLTVKGKVHPCTGTEAPYRPYGP